VFTGARYARSGNVNIAYQVVGDGPFDLVFVPGWISHLAYLWELPSLASVLDRLASFSRLILFDKRGTGLSDRVPDLPALEQRMDDVRAVMDAVGSKRAALMGVSEGGVMSALFAATYPERTIALVIVGGYPSWKQRQGYPWGRTEEENDRLVTRIESNWGRGHYANWYAPSQTGNAQLERWWGTFQQMSASPGDARALFLMNSDIDIRDAVPAIRVPALVVHARGDKVAPFEAGRYLAERIPGARFLELPSDDHWAYFDDKDRLLDEVEEFLTGVRGGPAPDSMLATVLCTTVAQAGVHALWLGDRRWKELVDRHNEVVRRALVSYRGREVEAGERGVTAVFDGTARAIRCALEIRDQLLEFGLRIKAGLHTGECEVAAGRPRGVALQIASGVMSAAQPGEVLVSGTVKDLVVGSGIEFGDRGGRELEGAPGSWRLFRAGPALSLDPVSEPAQATLSRREREVAELVATGLSNREIAGRLYLSERTVDNHVHRILAKLGFDSRVQVATWMARNEHLN
jgi:pimeloyl-ACP methyl ester carboxylesterase/DNA-binding CsgD family transcriptional regulator